MGKVVVFDSGLGSLSIILAIHKITKAEIVYFADQKNYPYGKKSVKELRNIIEHTINSLREKFKPDVIVIGSNTPTLLFPDLFTKNQAIMGVLPPLDVAEIKTRTNSIAILGTKAIILNKKTDLYIQKNLEKNIRVTKIDATKLIDLVESGIFIHNKQYCMTVINKTLAKKIQRHNIDVITLSSTHLPFLLPFLKKSFPSVQFLDPAMQVATQLKKNKFFIESTKKSLQIFSSADPKNLEQNLQKIKIKTKVKFLEI